MNRILIYAAILAALIGAGAWYGSSRYTAGRDDLLAEQAAQADKQRQADDHKTATADAGASQAKASGEQAQAASTEHTNTVVRTVTRIVHDSPSPVECRVPADSLRELAGAVDRANAAASGVSGTEPRREAAADVH